MRLEIEDGRLRLGPENEAERCQLWALKGKLETGRVEHVATVQWGEIDLSFPLKIIVGQ